MGFEHCSHVLLGKEVGLAFVRVRPALVLASTSVDLIGLVGSWHSC